MQSDNHTSSSARADLLLQGPPRTPGQIRARRPRRDCTVVASPLRPHVPASERLDAWITPHALDFAITLSTSGGSASHTRLRSVMLAGLDISTRKNYGAGLLRFTQFCDCHGISERARMPASEALLALFVARWAGHVSRSTIDTWIAGLSFWHTVNGTCLPYGKLLKATCAGALKLQPAARAKRLPVTVEHLHALRRGLDLQNTFDVAVYAVACIAFWCCRRLGELIIPSPGNFDPSKHVSKRAPVVYNTLPDGVAYASFHIPWSKTSHADGADIIATAVRDPTSAIEALRLHQSLNAKVPPEAPLFAYLSSDTSCGWSPLTRDWFLSRCNDVWRAADLVPLTGHCFRIGGATELLLRGTPPDIVAVQGGWRSRAFLEYWRRIETILPLFISNSFDSSRLKIARDSVSEFRRKYRA